MILFVPDIRPLGLRVVPLCVPGPISFPAAAQMKINKTETTIDSNQSGVFENNTMNRVKLASLTARVDYLKKIDFNPGKEVPSTTKQSRRKFLR